MNNIQSVNESITVPIISNLVGDADSWFAENEFFLNGRSAILACDFENNRFALKKQTRDIEDDFGMTRSGVASVSNFDGTAFDVNANETRIKGLNRVENISKDASNFVDASLDGWQIVSNATISADKTEFSVDGQGVTSGVRLRDFSGLPDNTIIKFTAELSMPVESDFEMRIQDSVGLSNDVISVGPDRAEYTVTRKIEGYPFNVGFFSQGTFSDVKVHKYQVEIIPNEFYGSNPIVPADQDYGYGKGVQYFTHDRGPYNYAVIYGDSFTNDSVDLASNLAQHMNLKFKTSGVAGYSLSQIKTAMLAEAPYEDSNFVLLQGGINTINGASTSPVEDMKSDMIAMVDHAIDNDLGFMVYTVAPYGSLSDTKKDWVVEYNAWLKAAYPENVVDIYTIVGDPANPTSLNPDYDSGDGLHPNAEGFRTIDNASQAVFKRLNKPSKITSDAGVLNEVSRENIAVPSSGETFSNTGVTFDGKLITEDTSSGFHRAWATTVSTETGDYTIRVRVRPNGRTWINLEERLNSATGRSTYFDLSGDGAVGAKHSSHTSSIEKLDNGEYICEIKITDAVARNGIVLVYMATGNNAPSYTGDGSSGIYLEHMQVEAGAFATSEIPTTSAKVTRSKDVLAALDVTDYYNTSEGTIYFEAIAPPENDSHQQFFNFSDASGFNNTITIFNSANDRAIRCWVRSGSAYYVNGVVFNPITEGQLIKCAISYKANEVNISVNGAIILSDTTVTLPTGINKLVIGDGLNSTLSKFACFDAATSQADLNALTS